MASKDRTKTQALTLFEDLAEAPWRWSFYAIMRQIESLFPDKPRFGESRRATDDPIRLGQEPSMAFAPAELAGFEPGKGGLPPRLRVHFHGLFGPNGPLPLHLTEYARSRQHNERDSTLSRFADIFHHRLLSLFYRAWANAQPALHLDRPEQDRFGRYVGSFIGLGMDNLQGRDALDDHAKFHFAGHFAGGTRPAAALRALCQEYFDVPIRIREYMGEWLELPDSSYLRLGRSRQTGTLADSATLGARIWGCQHRIRIVAGPLSYRDFRRLLPGRGGLARMVAAIRLFAGDEMSWDLQLILRHNEIPPLQLGKQGHLGRTSWLYDGNRTTDANDAILRVPRELGLEAVTS